jgi:aminocarboxymuconate-semialdehyde decarboxylase
MPVIDVHAHLVPEAFPPLPEGVTAAGWPEMVPLADGRARMMIDGREYRVFDTAYWDVPQRLARMDEEGVDLQVLSPLPELLSYWLSADTAEALARHTNAAMAEAVAKAGGRLAALGMLPLQDLDRALPMVAGLKRAGLKGIMVGSNINGVSIADARFDPLLAELVRHDLAIMVHGVRPAGTERLLGSPIMGAVIGVPQDAAMAVASFIATDVFARHPDLRLGFVHGGGSFGAMLERMDHVWQHFPEMRQGPISPVDYVRRFFFDTVVFSQKYLTYLIAAYGPDGLVAGSDGPTAIGQTGLDAFVRGAAPDDETAEKILWRNAVRFLKLDVGGARAVRAA